MSQAPSVQLRGISAAENLASGDTSGLGDGGAIHAKNLQTLAIHCCSFHGNKARADGGACWVSRSGLTVTSSSFSNSSAGESGGALLVEDSPSNVSVELATLGGNRARNGGALFLRNCSGAMLRFSGVDFVRNAAMDGSGGAVDALYVSGELRFLKCNFESNTAYVNGGALYVSTVLESAQDPRYKPSWVQSDYAQVNLAGGNARPYVIRNCTVRSNTAVTGNGSVALSGSTVMVIEDIAFEGNHAQSGGALWCSQNTAVNVSYGSFQGNAARFGGAMHVQDNCMLSLASTTMNSNTASECGGALSLNSTQPLFASGLIRAESNTADRSGGAGCILLKSEASPSECHGLLGTYPLMIAQGHNSILKVESNSAKGQGGGFFLSCVKPGDATRQVWLAQNLSSIAATTVLRRRILSVKPSMQGDFLSCKPLSLLRILMKFCLGLFETYDLIPIRLNEFICQTVSLDPIL